MKKSLILFMAVIIAASGHAAAQSAEQDTAAHSAAGVLKISTEPAEAAVTIGGQDYGVSPVEVTGLAVGAHAIELSLPGYFRRKATVHLDSAGAELFFELSRPAAVTITTQPPGAKIVINGDTAGTAPIRKERLRPEEYKISALADGHLQVDTTIKLSSGAEDTLRIVLKPSPPPDTTLEPIEDTPQAQDAVSDKGKDRSPNKKSWMPETILIAFFLFIAVMVGVESASY